MDKPTDRQTYRQTNIQTCRKHRARGPMLWKFRIRKAKHLLTDADSSTDNTLGWTRNTQKPNFFEKRKNIIQKEKLKNVQKCAKISDTPFDQRSLIHREAWFPGGPRTPKNSNCFKNGTKSSKMQKLKNVQEYAKISDTPIDQRSQIHREVLFPPCFLGKISKKKFVLFGDFRQLPNKNPAYGRQSISRPMRIVAPMPQEGGPRIPQNPI